MSNQRINENDDLRIKEIKPLIPPQILMEDIPLTPKATKTISETRQAASRIVTGADDRLLVICGPCSIHDTKAALEYAEKLREQAERLKGDLLVIMRVYFEKPRTTVGWKGLINDPDLDGSFQINKGLRIARKLLVDLNDLGVPCAVEYLDTISPQFIGDLVSWGAIGARTTESQIHRELTSGLSVPVGFKNGTDGGIQIAVDAIKAAQQSHHFLSVTKQGLAAIVCTGGNDSCHVILRGGSSGPNYSKENVQSVLEKLKSAGLRDALMVDCSHGNSSKNHKNQPLVAEDLSKQIEEGQKGIFGVMIESHLVEGKQNIPEEGPQYLRYGQSITDACISWKDTVPVLERLAEAVRKRRVKIGSK